MILPEPEKAEQSWEARIATSARHYMPRVWRSSTGEELAQAERYGAFARFMRRALPTAALVLALAVLVYALQPRETGQVAFTYERMGKIENDLAMINARLTGTSDDGLPFIVRAASATPEGTPPESVRLEDVQAEMTLKDGGTMRVTAAKGYVDSKTRQLDLTGGIRLTGENGYTAETASAKADLKSGILSGVSPVTAETTFGHLSANGFSFDKNTQILRFTGGVHIVQNGGRQ